MSYKQEQPTRSYGLKETSRDRRFSVSSLIDTPMSTSAIRLQEPGMVLELDNSRAVLGHHSGSHSVSRTVSHGKGVFPGREACDDIHNIPS